MKRDKTTDIDKRRGMLMHAVTMLHVWGYLGDVQALKIRKRIFAKEQPKPTNHPSTTNTNGRG